MNIVMDTQTLPNAVNTESSKTVNTNTYRPQSMEMANKNCGYSLDIADRVMDNNAYKSQGTTGDELMQAAQSTDAAIQKDYMVVMSNTVSKEDFGKMQEEGFDASSTDVETYVNIVDQIKVTLAKSGVSVAGYTDDIDPEVAKEILGSEVNVNELFNNLKNADLPVTEDILNSFKEMKDLASNIKGLSEDALKFMVVNKETPTVENLYLAQFSSAKVLKQASGYYSDDFNYYSKKADYSTLKTFSGNISNQIDKVIENAGLEVNDETKEQAKWLILSGIECNSENMTRLSEIENIEFPISEKQLIDTTINAIKNGVEPKKMSLTKTDDLTEKAKEIFETVNNLSEESVGLVVEENQTVNIKNLEKAETRLKEDALLYSINTNNVSEKDLKQLEARANLEEIRLMMSVEANKELLKKGIQIDVMELSDLVDNLKETIANIKNKIFQGNSIEENESREDIFNETLEKTNEIKSFPVDLIGNYKNFSVTTINEIHKEGLEIKGVYKKLNKTYEEIMTKPRTDLGDSIKKAFRNIDELLDEINLETTEENKRAVRILGYNQMEITEENIAAVKEADAQIQSVIKRMTPGNTLFMIRDGKNPLEMSIEEINTYLDEKEDEGGSGEEKFSKFLQKLDRANKISEDERKAYMGIYRMFRQIEKSDGAAVGNLIATNASINFKNMLSAVRSANKKNIDVTIDEEYGALEKLIQKNSSISGDINSAFNNIVQTPEYYGALSKDITRELSSGTDIEKLSELEIRETTTIEAFAEDLKDIKKETGNNNNDLNTAFKDYGTQMKSAEAVEEAVIQRLIDLDIPISIDNILSTNELIQQKGVFFKQIFDASSNNEEDGEEDKDLENAKDELISNFTDSKNAKKAYENLIKVSRKKVHDMTDVSKNLIDLKACKSICKTLSLANNLAKRECYEIPVEIDGEITSINLEIYHDNNKKGNIMINMETQELGKVAAQIKATEEKVTGMMVYEKKSSKSKIGILEQSLAEEINKSFKNDMNVNISVVQSEKIDFYNFSAQDRDLDSALPTKDLYTVAKAFLVAVQKGSN